MKSGGKIRVLKIYNNYYGWNKLSTIAAAILSLFILLGCAGGNYGKLDRDRDLDNMFLNYQILPDHRYYTTGGYDAPKAILAIRNDYELYDPGNLWLAIPHVNSGQMRKWIDTLAPDQNYRWSGQYFAAYIIDPGGKKVGAWYAIENYTTVKFPGDKRIEVYPPSREQDITMENDFRGR
jgi:hypothetical protein